jgi:hypothetical protein
MSYVSSYQESQPYTWKVGECKEFIQTSYQCSYITLDSITHPNGSVETVFQNMTKSGNTYTYSYCANGGKGEGSFNSLCPELNTSSPVSFVVTASGYRLTEAKATSYTWLIIFSILFFIAFLIMGLALPSGNKKDEMTGYILAVNNLKYLKLVFLGIAYLISVFITYTVWMITYAYLDMDFLSNMFRFLFTFQAILIIPLFILFAYLTISNLIRDSKIGDYLMRGLRTR